MATIVESSYIKEFLKDPAVNKQILQILKQHNLEKSLAL